MQYYMRVQSGFVAESESELGAATGLIRALDVRWAPGEERSLVSVVVSQDLVHWTLYHLPVPEPRQADVPAEGWQARAEAAEARAAQAEAAGYRRAIDEACAAIEAEHRQALEEHRKQSDHEWRSANYGRLSALREVESVVRALAPAEPVSKADELPGGDR